MNKKILTTLVVALLLVTTILLIACAKIDNDPNVQAKALEEKGCTVTVIDQKQALQDQSDFLADKGIILINDIRAILTIQKDGEEGYIYYLGSLSDAETLNDNLVFLGNYQTAMQSTDIVYFGSKAIYDLMK